MAREPEQQDHTKKEPGCKTLAFLDSEQQKRQTSFFRMWIRTLVFLCMGRSFRKSFMEMRVVMFFLTDNGFFPKRQLWRGTNSGSVPAGHRILKVLKIPWSIFSGLFI